MQTRPISRPWFLPLLLSIWLPGVVLALDMEDVVRLHASGYSDDEINEFLSATQSEFMLSARDVVYLSQSGVSDPLVQGMLVALPLQPVNGDATLEAEPVRLLFSEEDLQLLAENQISDPVVVTFIETRDMAFTLDSDRFSALRQYGLGLDPLQVLVEKNAANVSVPLAPPAPEVMAGTGYVPRYFYGRSGNSPGLYAEPYSTTTYYGSPSLYIQSGTIHPWYGYEFEPRHGYGPAYGYGYGPGYGYGSGYGYDSGFGFGYGYGFAPHYANYYPYRWSGFHGHSFYCPRGGHHHGGGGHHGRDGHDGWDRDRDHDWDRDDHRDGNLVAGPGRGKPGGTKPVFVARDNPAVAKPGRGKPGGAKPVFVAGSDPVVTRPAGGKPIVSKPAGVKPGKGTGVQSVASTGNRTVATIWGNGTKPVSGSTRIPGGQSNTADPFYGTGIKRAGTKSEPAAGHINGGKPYRTVTTGNSRSSATNVVAGRNPGAVGTGNKNSGNPGVGGSSPAASANGFRSPGGNVAAVRTSPGNSTAAPSTPRSVVTSRVAATPANAGDGGSTRGRGSDRDDGTSGRARGFKAGTSTNSVAYQGRQSKPQ